MQNIRIEWDGPYSLFDIGYDEKEDKYLSKKIEFLNDQKKDMGVYQIYGQHPVYGSNVLLYIGKTETQTFAKRLSQEFWQYNSDYKNIQIYVGRLFGEYQPSDKEWNTMINIAERMLIYAHSPSMNSSNIQNIFRDKRKLKEFENIRIFNYDNYRSLMPEVSGELWIKEFENFKGVYGDMEG